MTDTLMVRLPPVMDMRTVRLEQIAIGRIAGFHKFAGSAVPVLKRLPNGELGHSIYIKCRQIGDATGGDVFEPINGLEAGLAEDLRRAKWPHPVQVEVVT